LSARTKGEERATNDSMKELRREFERRIPDIQADIESGQTGMAEEAIAALRKEFEQRMLEIRDQIDESFEPGRDAIRERPIASVGVAIGLGITAGVLFGALLLRSSSKKD
jgi:ElaB/YqjD/DUF883 family membrane-anchored ribosome-binding protein